MQSIPLTWPEGALLVCFSLGSWNRQLVRNASLPPCLPSLSPFMISLLRCRWACFPSCFAFWPALGCFGALSPKLISLYCMILCATSHGRGCGRDAGALSRLLHVVLSSVLYLVAAFEIFCGIVLSKFSKYINDLREGLLI